MGWRALAKPLFVVSHVPRRAHGQPAVKLPCPPGLTAKLGHNGLMPCLDTLTDGNCGIHAFVLALVAKVQKILKDQTITCENLQAQGLGAMGPWAHGPGPFGPWAPPSVDSSLL